MVTRIHQGAIVTAIVLAAVPASADVIHVPADQPTIQAGIDAAVEGDEVLVAAGTYEESIDFGGKAITVRSDAGFGEATITHPVGPIVYFNNGEGNDSVLHGFRLTGSFISSVYITDSSPSIELCLFELMSGVEGGAIFMSDSAPRLVQCLFGNTSASLGGAIYVAASTPELLYCDFVFCTAGDGAAIFQDATSHSTIRDCDFTLCSTIGDSGAIYNDGGTLDVSDSTFVGNAAMDDGGALFSIGGSVRIDRCRLRGNEAESGGAMSLRGDAEVVNCIFIANSAADFGGAIWMPHSPFDEGPVVTSCSFASNQAALLGGAVAAQLGFVGDPVERPMLSNSIFWANAPDQLSDPDALLDVAYCDVQGGWPGEGNLDADPMFVDLAGDDGVPGTWDDDLRLDRFSPCTDAGDNGRVPGWVLGDFRDDPRRFDDAGVADTGAGMPPIVDIGAYERQAHSMPQEIDVHPGGSIQAAIDAAWPGDTVQVHAGVYPEVIDLLGKAITVRAIDGPGTVVIDGTGLGTSVITCAGGEGRDTVLEGLTATGGTGAPVGDVSRGGGMYISGASPTLVSCVFVQNAATYGGGLYVIGGSSVPLLERCVFEDNTADSYGGGLYTYRYSYALLSECSFLGNSAEGGGGAVVGRGSFVDCAFTLNSAGSFGGAIHMIGSIHVDRCVFTGNEAMQGGAFYGGEPIELLDGLPYDIELTRCRFVGNAATGDGGAVYVWNDLAVTSCTLIGNTAESGGAIFVRSTYDAFVGNSVLSSNTATGDGGALHVGSSCDLEVTGCTITGNAAGGGGGGVWSDSGFALRNSIAWGNTAGGAHPQVRGGGGVRSSDVEGSGGSGPGWDEALGIDLGGNVDADPLLVDPDGADDVPGTADDDVRLGPWSPCLDAGDDTLVPADAYDLDGDGDTAEPLPVDLDGHARFFDDPAADTGVSDGVRPVVDMGAYERCAYCPNGIPADTNADGVVDVDDLVNVILDWGTDGVLHGGDVTRDGVVDVDDLSGNTAGQTGGGAECSGSELRLTACTFRSNSATLSGDSVHGAQGGSLHISRSVFVDHVDSPLVSSIPMVLRSCSFFASGDSAIVITGEIDLEAINCVFSGGTSDDGGAAIYVQAAASLTLANCTFCANARPGGGDGSVLRLGSSSDNLVTNCIFWDNDPSPISLPGTATLQLEHSTVEGGWPGEGNIDLAPVFVDAVGPDAMLGTEDDDLRLSEGSPCVDAGSNLALPEDVVTDAAGHPRFVDDPTAPDSGLGDPPIVDIGAYERQLPACPGDADGSGAVDVDDLLAVILDWDTDGSLHGGDVDGSGLVDVDDLIGVITSWGPCP